VSLSIRHVSKRFGAAVALEDFSLEIGAEEFVCLLGPSGCGKTTLLRMVAGLEEVSQGQILLDGKDLTWVPARERGFGIVFQSYSLFPNLTVAQNVGYGLKLRKTPRAEIAREVARLLALIEMTGYDRRLPHQLSGGQQQRVALARALAVRPKLLLLDEPLSALDAKVRLVLRDQIRDLQRKLRIPTLMVTHDQEEALSMADRIVCMEAGRIAQVDSPTGLYTLPKTRFVADFVGHMNVLPLDQGGRLAERTFVAGNGATVGGERVFGVRPEHITLAPAGTDGENHFPAKVTAVRFLGAHTRIDADIGPAVLVVVILGEAPVRLGAEVSVHIPKARVVELQ
jgi:iron(III) transport system ATP-binding protein